MNRIAKIVKSSGVTTLIVALLASYLGASAAVNLAQRDLKDQPSPVFKLVDDPVPCARC
jgi:hypothetical protein